MKVGYSKTYPIALNGTWEKIWLEDEIASGSEEEVRKAQYALKRQVENFHYESKAAAEKQMGTQVTVGEIYNNAETETLVPSLTKVAAIIRDINSCTDLKVLESYKLIVKGDEDLQDAYYKKYSELSKIKKHD